MKLTIHWYESKDRYSGVICRLDSATLKDLMLDEAERERLANHLREVADDLSPMPTEDNHD